MSSTLKWAGRLVLLTVCASATASSLLAQNCNSSQGYFRLPRICMPSMGAPNTGAPNAGKPAHMSGAGGILAPYSSTEMDRVRQFHQRREQALYALSPVERQRIALMWDRERALVNLSPAQRRYLIQQWGNEGVFSPGEYQYMQQVWGDDLAPMPGYTPSMGPGGMLSWFDGLGQHQPADAPAGLPYFGLRPLVDHEPCEPRHPVVQKLLGSPKPLEPVMPLPTYTTRGPRDFLLNDNPSSIGY
ncbi:MAG: hypothetical protein ACRC46_04640 [Thermoguttaceae bacterium]